MAWSQFSLCLVLVLNHLLFVRRPSLVSYVVCNCPEQALEIGFKPKNQTIYIYFSECAPQISKTPLSIYLKKKKNFREYSSRSCYKFRQHSYCYDFATRNIIAREGPHVVIVLTQLCVHQFLVQFLTCQLGNAVKVENLQNKKSNWSINFH